MMEPTVDLHERFTVAEADIDLFNSQGFVRISNVLTKRSIMAYETEVTKRVMELNTMHLPLEERNTYNKAFLQVTNIWEHSSVVKEFVFSRRLAQIAADLMGAPAVRLYHDQALYKEPGGGMTPWHADQYYFPLKTDNICTVWVPLQDTPLEMGPLAFSNGSHHFEFGRDLEISDESETALQEALAEQDFSISEEPYVLGEVSYHLGWTFHRAAPNRSKLPRRVMTIIYFDARATVSEPTNEHQRADLARWMPGAAVGTSPATALNPLLYEG